MAMISCKKCGKEVSSEAVKCPECGAGLKMTIRDIFGKILKWSFIFFNLLMFIIVFFTLVIEGEGIISIFRVMRHVILIIFNTLFFGADSTEDIIREYCISHNTVEISVDIVIWLIFDIIFGIFISLTRPKK